MQGHWEHTWSYSSQGPHLHHALDGVHALEEQVHVELLEAGARYAAVEVDALEQGVNLDGGLRSHGGHSVYKGKCVRSASCLMLRRYNCIVSQTGCDWRTREGVVGKRSTLRCKTLPLLNLCSAAELVYCQQVFAFIRPPKSSNSSPFHDFHFLPVH